VYCNHVPVIAAAMRACPETFERGVMFAILSARVRFSRVPQSMRDLERHGARASCLWGFKKRAWEYVRANRDSLWRDACAARDPETALRVLCRVPGLGIIKGGFVCQMLGFDIACLDTRNVAREGRDMRTYTCAHKSKPGFDRRLVRYVQETEGRACELWDTWCSDVAETYATTAHEISARHLTSIVPKRLRTIAPLEVPLVPEPIPF
jgi:hypothetical protein